MKLYVGNLAYSVNDASLKAIFEPYGNVESARVISDRDSGQSKGFGFVEMSDADGQKAMGALNGQELEPSQEDEVATLVAVADGSLGEPELAAWLRRNSRRQRR